MDTAGIPNLAERESGPDGDAVLYRVAPGAACCKPTHRYSATAFLTAVQPSGSNKEFALWNFPR